MAIVLVVIGLLVGAILVGRNLIDNAATRAQITQIEKYNQAVNTFRGKYGYMPGDIRDPDASNFGFQPRGLYPGQGDGDGILGENCTDTPTGLNHYAVGCSGEAAVFWEDLSSANLIDAQILGQDKISGHYPSTTVTNAPTLTLTSTPGIKDWFPPAKIAPNAFVYVFSMSSKSYFFVSTVTTLQRYIGSTLNPGITVQQAYNIDSKIDDGLPQTGTVLACYANYTASGVVAPVSPIGINSGMTSGAGAYNAPNDNYCNVLTTATPYTNYNCFDNNSSAGTQTYSMQNANIDNCALSFQFQ